MYDIVIRCKSLQYNKCKTGITATPCYHFNFIASFAHQTNFIFVYSEVLFAASTLTAGSVLWFFTHRNIKNNINLQYSVDVSILKDPLCYKLISLPDACIQNDILHGYFNGGSSIEIEKS